jgi:hypothetical protein
MHYDFIAIPAADVPLAVDPTFQHVLQTYASEANKTENRPAPARWTGSGPGLDSLLAARRVGPVEKEYLGPKLRIR